MAPNRRSVVWLSAAPTGGSIPSAKLSWVKPLGSFIDGTEFGRWFRPAPLLFEIVDRIFCEVRSFFGFPPGGFLLPWCWDF